LLEDTKPKSLTDFGYTIKQWEARRSLFSVFGSNITWFHVYDWV